MKRDNDFLRQLLLEIVDDPLPQRDYRFFHQPSGEELKLEYHIDKLVEAQFLAVKNEHVEPFGKGGTIFKGRRQIRSLTVSATNSGHDYLDAIRDNDIWSKTKQAVVETGGSATLDMIKSLGIGFLKTKIEKHTGIAL